MSSPASHAPPDNSAPHSLRITALNLQLRGIAKVNRIHPPGVVVILHSGPKWWTNSNFHYNPLRSYQYNQTASKWKIKTSYVEGVEVKVCFLVPPLRVNLSSKCFQKLLYSNQYQRSNQKKNIMDVSCCRDAGCRLCVCAGVTGPRGSSSRHFSPGRRRFTLLSRSSGCKIQPEHRGLPRWLNIMTCKPIK